MINLNDPQTAQAERSPWQQTNRQRRSRLWGVQIIATLAKLPIRLLPVFYTSTEIQTERRRTRFAMEQEPALGISNRKCGQDLLHFVGAK